MKSARVQRPVPKRAPSGERIVALALGSWIGLSLLKFGNPVIFEEIITPPRGLAEWVFTSWPVSWGRVILAVAALISLARIRPFFRKDQWPVALLAAWLFWQLVSGARSVEPKLTLITLIHFMSCGVSFLIGWWCLSQMERTEWFWAPVLACLVLVLFAGFDQHHGGLETTRQAFYEQPNWRLYPREYLLKIQSDRVFATLVYPNAFAGAILLFLPAALWQCWTLAKRWPRIARGVILGFVAYLGVGCFFWTGSKGGWLIALIIGMVLLLHLRFSKKLKFAIVLAFLALGLAAFFLRFSGYFQKGATSASARFIYWQGALQTALAHPVFGTGPGTFQIPFRQVKPPEAEMARLVHNDYLEQASDSGFPGLITFTGFVFASLVSLYRKSRAAGWEFFLIWLGLLAWSLQSFIEFGLYIPALAWPVFLWFGWLFGLDEKAGKRGAAAL